VGLQGAPSGDQAASRVIDELNEKGADVLLGVLSIIQLKGLGLQHSKEEEIT